MNKDEANELLSQMKDALNITFPNMTAKLGRTTFDANTINFKFSLTFDDALDEVADKDSKAGMIKNNVHPEAIGIRIYHAGNLFEIVSVKNRKCKYPVLARKLENGKLYKFAEKFVNEQVNESDDCDFLFENYRYDGKAIGTMKGQP